MTDSPTAQEPPIGEEPETANARQWVKDLAEGEHVSEFYAVRKAPEQLGSNGVRMLVGDFHDLTLFTFKIPGVFRTAAADVGTVVHVEGRFATHPEWGKQIDVEAVRKPKEDDIYDPLQLYPISPTPLAELDKGLGKLLAKFHREESAHLVALLKLLLRTGEMADRWQHAPATLEGPYAYRHGGFERAWLDARSVSELAKIHGWEHDIAVTCALVRYYGIVERFEPLPIGFRESVLGVLEGGDAPAGSYFVRKAIEEVGGFPSKDAEDVRHALWADKKGSGVTSRTREVSGVAGVDETTTKEGWHAKARREAPEGAAWSRTYEELGGSAYLGEGPA